MKCIMSFETEFMLNHEGTPKNCPLNSNWMSLVKKQVDGSPVARLFYEWRDLSELPVKETNPVEVQAAKLIVAHKYKNLRDHQLYQQLEAYSE